MCLPCFNSKPKPYSAIINYIKRKHPKYQNCPNFVYKHSTEIGQEDVLLLHVYNKIAEKRFNGILKANDARLQEKNLKNMFEIEAKRGGLISFEVVGDGGVRFFVKILTSQYNASLDPTKAPKKQLIRSKIQVNNDVEAHKECHRTLGEKEKNLKTMTEEGVKPPETLSKKKFSKSVIEKLRIEEGNEEPLPVSEELVFNVIATPPLIKLRTLPQIMSEIRVHEKKLRGRLKCSLVRPEVAKPCVQYGNFLSNIKANEVSSSTYKSE